MTLQEKTIHRYRQLYPRDTIKKISLRTGIQVTRVYRIFHGRSMKVIELEAIEKVIVSSILKKTECNKLSMTLDEASLVLTNEELEKVHEYIKRKVSTKAYGRPHPAYNYKQAIIA